MVALGTSASTGTAFQTCLGVSVQSRASTGLEVLADTRSTNSRCAVSRNVSGPSISFLSRPGTPSLAASKFRFSNGKRPVRACRSKSTDIGEVSQPCTPDIRMAADGVAAPAQDASAAAALASNLSDLERVTVLSEALPYMQRFTGKTIVIKYGGAAMKDGSLKDLVIRDLIFLSLVGIRPIFVHGGGPEINAWLAKIGIEPNFKNGLRVTDGPTMEVVDMVLTGKVNKELVALINAAGGNAVGLCGKDGKLFPPIPQDLEYGFVGEPGTVNPRILDVLTEAGYIPVVASVTADPATGQAYNINADTAAGEIAAAVKAEKLILLTDVPGIMKDPKDLSTLYASTTVSGVKQLIEDGIVSGGMIPKVQCCANVLKRGVKAAHIIDGRKPHSLLLEIFTKGGIGTMVLPDEPSNSFYSAI